ncbi:MAG TPA: fibronectin type III domain-containing protein [Candidatus Acidoferrales bacterium]|nr:fibronectin type III domain-containing protein [Candidatus Acidoferrales bacterium]
MAEKTPDCPRGARIRERRTAALLPFILLLSIMTAMCAGGCASPGEPVARKAAVPQAIADLAVHQEGNDAVLSFTMPKETARGKALTKTPSIEIYRAFQSPSPNPAGSQATAALILTIPPAMVARYAQDGGVRISDALESADLARHSGWTAEYTVRTSISGKKLSAPSNAASIRVYPAANPIEDLKASVTEHAVLLSWTAPQATLAGAAPTPADYHVYRMEKPAAGAAPKPAAARPETPFSALEGKKSAGQAGFVQIGETTAPGYSDTHFQFGASYVYSVRSVLPYDGEKLESADSNVVALTPRDVFPPAPPQGVVVAYVSPQAGRPAYLDLSWAIGTETDLAGYNVYRSEEAGAHGTRVNTQLLPTPSFRDMNAQPGHRYFYTVTAQDGAGNESAPSAAASGDVPAESQSSHDNR